MRTAPSVHDRMELLVRPVGVVHSAVDHFVQCHAEVVLDRYQQARSVPSKINIVVLHFSCFNRRLAQSADGAQCP
jgi:hypothetical protein